MTVARLLCLNSFFFFFFCVSNVPTRISPEKVYSVCCRVCANVLAIGVHFRTVRNLLQRERKRVGSCCVLGNLIFFYRIASSRFLSSRGFCCFQDINASSWVIPNRRRCRSSIFHGDMSRFSFWVSTIQNLV